MRNLTDTMICWNPGGEVALFPWPDTTRASKPYRRTYGACCREVPGMDFEQRKLMVFIEAAVLIVRDRCDPQVVHQALLGLEEYVDGLPSDMLPKHLLAQRRDLEAE